MYEETEKGNIINSNNILDYFDDVDIINYLSGIMSYDFEISDINKCIEDLSSIYNKEKLLYIRNDIIKRLDDSEKLSDDEVRDLERELNEIVLKLAKIK